MRTPVVSTSAVAPGKVILLGEHSVVYGRPALAAAIDRHVEVCVAPHSTFDSSLWRSAGLLPSPLVRYASDRLGISDWRLAVRATGNLPIGVGLGSSAALSVSLVRALAASADVPLDAATTCQHAYGLERLFHGHPSGVDNTVATYGGLLRFTRGAPLHRVVTAPLPLVVAIGRAPRATRRAVTALRSRWEADATSYEAIFDRIAALVADAEAAIVDADLRTLGAAMTANHELLRRCGVSTDELDAMVALARAHRAYGAKLTGGGGGGAIIGLCPEQRERCVAAFQRAGWEAFATDIVSEGGADGTRIDEIERAVARA